MRSGSANFRDGIRTLSRAPANENTIIDNFRDSSAPLDAKDVAATADAGDAGNFA